MDGLTGASNAYVEQLNLLARRMAWDREEVSSCKAIKNNCDAGIKAVHRTCEVAGSW